MSVAVRIARTYTKKDKVLFCGYHGCFDWYLAANLGKKGALDKLWIAGLSPNGVPKGLTGTAIPFIFNDEKSLQAALDEAGDDLAAIVMEPMRNYRPKKEFIDMVHQAVRSRNAPLIMDEISSGFRICNGGAHLKMGFKPDMAVFAKAIGNGFPISAIIGRREVMNAAQDAFITSTNWTERTGPAAALAMINKFIAYDASKHLVALADKVWDGWESLAGKHGLEIHIGGISPMIHFSFAENNNVNRAYFTQEMLKKGFLASAGFYAMYAHSFEDIDKYLTACDEVFGELSKLIAANAVEANLQGEAAKTGFARIN